MNKFKTYQALHKKLASAFFEKDENVRKLVDTLVDSELNNKINSLIKLFSEE